MGVALFEHPRYLSCMATTEPILIELDSRRRATLGRLGHGRTRFLASEAEDGTITLAPAVVITELEARLHGQPEVMARIQNAFEGRDLIEASESDKALGL